MASRIRYARYTVWGKDKMGLVSGAQAYTKKEALKLKNLFVNKKHYFKRAFIRKEF
jgi:hypothetical protein